ncbi:DUF6065 family protein [Bradyrhizobium japonicum]|uniref:DUF6065 family protein n=1 Tax=Bradyrhizobium japonicum TaxID=375 RepID=UPI0011DDE2D3|nr:DUF6065 family protein [Bradyrhizobium japonicum]MCD9109072.1 DUF6065 family protein [Bradyrhizobium japonicum]MCD9259646.1 DUF6065 family protein [Bradyrhizobium japonicum SEMIA 5079]MCD9820536.1 DUF6065 family protein [Bradyrhizobium japonicum]MCD9892783.1 DUF6065 family protein [Bradyrhizobium japonicum]MCD9912271.1 DUF6065 family protein [Bradyrhizobium japonicum]
MNDPNIDAPNDIIISFCRAVPESQSPMRADSSALGILPTAAFQYCEAARSASAFGWYVFSPMTFYLQWDGTDVLWTYKNAESWLPLTTCHFPQFSEQFDKIAPEDVKGFAPPFLTKIFAPGVVQIWSGLLVKTAPDWSVLVRPPANIPRSQCYELYEGIVETDRWFGPLFVNIRITATNRPIEFSTECPLFQVQPLRRDTYSERYLQSFNFTESLSAFTAEDWSAYRETVVKPNEQRYRSVGQYAASVRKRSRSLGVSRVDPTSSS